MYFPILGLLFLLLPALTLSTPILDLPTAQEVKQSVVDIHNAVLELDATVQAFTGGSLDTTLVEGKEVLAGVGKIHIVNREGFRRALAALPFNVKDTVDVIDTVVATVNISIPLSTQHIREKEAVFKANGLSAAVIAGLALLEYDHDTFSAATAMNFNLATDAKKLEEGIEAVANIHEVIAGAFLFYTVNAVV